MGAAARAGRTYTVSMHPRHTGRVVAGAMRCLATAYCGVPSRSLSYSPFGDACLLACRFVRAGSTTLPVRDTPRAAATGGWRPRRPPPASLAMPRWGAAWLLLCLPQLLQRPGLQRPSDPPYRGPRRASGRRSGAAWKAAGLLRCRRACVRRCARVCARVGKLGG